MIATPKRLTRAILSDYWRATRRYPTLLAIALVTGTLVQCTTIAAPLYLKEFLDLVSLGSPGDETNVGALHRTLWTFAALVFASWALRRAEFMAMYRMEARVMSDIDNRSFAHLIRHSYHFFISNFAGSLVRRVGRYRKSYEVIADAILFQLYPAALLSVGIIAVLSFRHPWLGATLGVWTVLFVAIQYALIRWLHPLRLAHAKEDSATTGVLADAVTNHATIRLFSGIAYEEGLFAQAVEKLRKAAVRSWSWDDLIWTVQGFLAALINVVMLWGALVLWRRGALTVGDFVLIQSYLLTLFERLVNIGRELRHVFSALADASEMREVLDMPPAIADAPGAVPLRVKEGAIAFKHVSFYFHPSAPVLSDFTLTIKGGEKVALVGPSGGGKSTIIKLLLRLYDVREGAIEIDGQNIARVTQDSLHDNIAFVPQEPVLFHRSLLDNIRYGKRDASDEEVYEAARRAHCHEFIARLPHGYQTLVGERGVKLSGGERQRIAIARAILKNAPILVLDEATSSLDSESERYIQEALEDSMKGKTVLIVAHRLSTIQKADRIVVVERGAIVDQGTHEELRAKRTGLYRKLWSIQAGGFLSDT